MVNLNLASKTEDHQHLLTPENKIFRAVLAQAIDDHLGNNQQHMNYREKRESKEWLDLKNPDFTQVCEYAKLEPRYVYGKIMKYINKKGKINVFKMVR